MKKTYTIWKGPDSDWRFVLLFFCVMASLGILTGFLILVGNLMDRCR